MTNTSISRMPNPAEFVPELNDISAALFRATGNRSVPRTTMSPVHLRAGQIVGNTYLTILMVPDSAATAPHFECFTSPLIVDGKPRAGSSTTR